MRILCGFLVVVLSTACNALDAKGTDTGQKLVIPTDTRAVQQALRSPPAISGGTLAVSADGRFAVAADPDRDRISVVELATGTVRSVALKPGDEPGRVTFDARGQAYIALRRAGSVVSVDVASASLVQRAQVCAAPRGLAYDATGDLLHVACASGQLVSLNTATLAPMRSLDLGTDLRDVIVRGEELLVTTFKQAELLTVDASGAMISRRQPSSSATAMTFRNLPNVAGELQTLTLQPEVAWRTIPSANGGVIMLHQHAADTEIDVGKHPDGESAPAYGGDSGGCSGIVQTGVTEFGADGTPLTSNLASIVLPTDVARSSMTGQWAIAQAGQADPSAPRPFTVFDGSESGGSFPGVGRSIGGSPFPTSDGDTSVALVDENMRATSDDTSFEGSTNCSFAQAMPVPGQATAVAYTPTGDLIVQTREPAALVLMRSPPSGQQSLIQLGGDSVRDTGHDTFHRDSGGGIACASCHPEGGDDGHTWLFSTVGLRRTQALNVGLKDTAPFHWNGDMRDIGALMEEVFVGRMGGVHQSKPRLTALTDWVFAQKPPTPIVATDDPAALRGHELFDSDKLGCATCHSGRTLTNNKSYDVGTSDSGELLQVPSLRGIGYRAPFLHDGCAQTLRDRFDPNCGGASHGNVAGISAEQTDDLVAYLRSL